MNTDRREFLKRLGLLTAGGCGALAAGEALAGEHAQAAAPDANGMLVDLGVCTGCRSCEYNCKKTNGMDPGPLATANDPAVFQHKRRPDVDAFTVVNVWPREGDPEHPVYAKINCMHCVHPACASACIVGALRKRENGPVTYDAWKCIGCRYCMVACPFQIPAYSYEKALTPEVRKCTFCFERKGGPACAEICPPNALRFGKRADLLKYAHDKIRENPGRYINHVYGEHEIGGTSWLYISPIPFEQAGFLTLGDDAPPATTEAIQHGVFKHGIPPLALYGILGTLMFLTRPRRQARSTVISHEETAGESDVREHEHGHRELSAAASDDSLGSPDEAATAVAVAEAPVERDAGDVERAALGRDSGGRTAEGRASHDGNGNHDHHAAHHDEAPAAVRRTLLTPGVFFLVGLALTGLGFGLYRFLFGLGASTNLDQQHPWGLWIGIDVASGVALAAGGFTSAFLTHILHREHYHAIARPALLTAMLGYTFVCIGLQADLGRYYNVWHPMIMWQGNSVLFEVGMCVMCYLNVLYMEFAPIACERMMLEQKRFPRLTRLATFVNGRLEGPMFLLVIAGCCLSCLHQSSLGNLMVIAPYKLHALWWTPWSPLLFLLSAIAVGFPMVIWESLFASWSLKLKPEMSVLSPLARFIPFTLGIYLTAKLTDVIHRGAWRHLSEGSLQSTCWMIEIASGIAIPMLMLMVPAIRRSPRLLFTAVTLIVAGVLFNRVNVFLIGYRPPYATKTYIPSIGEFAVTIGLIAALMLCYRLIVTFLPVISQPKARVAA